jgi:hypothetical protein
MPHSQGSAWRAIQVGSASSLNSLLRESMNALLKTASNPSLIVDNGISPDSV